MLTMFMAISDERLEPTDRTQFTFIETQPEYPLPIKEWFYPGHLRGLEFVYPKDQAMKIAEHAREPVLAADTNDLHDLASIKVEAIGPLGTPLPAAESAANVTNQSTVTEQQSTTTTESKAPAVAENTPPPEPQQPEVEQHNEENTQIAQNTEPAPVRAQEPQVQQPAPQTQAPAPTEENRELPRTAGELPLIALIGALCLGAGLGLKVLSARS
jgi:type IV secretory pathway VirB10-like protein